MNTTIINALVKGLGKKSVILTAILIVSGFFVASFALAAEGVAISPATGGENVSIDTTFPGGTGDYTTLDSFSITESVPGQITQGVHTISLPSGWEFNMASTITIFRTDAIVLASYNITPDQTSFSFTVNSISTSNSTLFFNGLQVRPTTQHPNTSNGNITHSGADIIGVTNGSTSFGTLSTVAGTVTKLAFTTQPGSAEYGSNLSPQPVVKTQDQFGNDSTSGLAANLDVTLTKTSGTGVLTGTNVLDIGTGVGNGIATFTNLTVDEFGTGKQLTASAGGLAPAISTDFEITQAPLTITAEGKTKVYGTANPGLTAAYSGFVNGETSTVLTSPVILSVPADATSPVGPYVITASGATATNYSIIFVPGTLTITQAPLTITADAQTKIYGGTDPALTYQITSGALVNGDILTGSLSRVAGENVGTRAIEQGDLDNSNYDISFVSADLTITTKPITVTAVTNTKTYNGNMDAIATPTFPEGSLVGSDTANFIEAYDTKNVGTEKILTPSGVVDDGNGGDNYSYNFIADLTGAITQASLTATITVSNKVVDGNNSATITGRTLIGVIGDDIVTPNEDGVAIFEDAIIGNDKIVTATGITITGADVANYFYDGTATGTGNILPIPTVVFVDANWVGTENWIDPDGEGPATYFGYDAFATIQEAVSAVEEGGVVNVLVGIYTESIIINKTLSVVGVGSTTVIQPAIDTDGITITADGVVIKDVKVSTSNSSIPPDVTPNKAISVEEADNLEINNIIVETTGDGAMGIWIGGSNNGMDPVSGLTIIKSDITVNNEATGIYADHSTPAHSGWLVGGSAENANTVTVPLGNPIELYDVTDSEVSHNTITTSASGGSATIWSSELSDLSNLIFNDNAVSYSGGSQVAFLTDFISSLRGDIPPDTNVSNVTVSGNTFNDWGLRGLRIGDGVTSVIVSENKFLGTGEALKNEDVSGVNAEGNWWGSAVLSTVGSKINGTVDFDPYYVENGMSILSDIPVTVAYVDSTYTDGLENDSHYFGYDAFNTIQEGINAVEAGGTVNVADGNYAETIGTCDGDAAMFCIEKSLTITGDPGAQGETIDDAGPAGTPVIDGDGAFASAFVISSGVSNITIEGFEIHNFANDPALFTGGIGSAVLSWNSGATNITVQDNYLHDLGWNGVLVGSDDGTTQSGWTVKRNIIEGADYAGIELTNVTNSEVAFNDVTIGEGISWDPNDSGVGIEVAVRDHGTEVTAGANVSVHDNEITGDGVAPERAGINILSRAYQAASNALLDGVTIENNTVTGATRGIFVVAEERNDGSAEVSGLSIEGNTIAGNDVGIEVGLQSGSPHQNGTYDVAVLSNSIDGNDFGLDNTTGIEIDASQNWWGDSLGPEHSSNPGGTGDAVSDNVDYRPWYTTADLTGLDVDSPTVGISSTETSPTNASPIPITITFSESVYNFEIGDIDVANGTPANLLTSDNTVYTVDITPTADDEVTVDIAAEVSWDLAGNYNTAATQFSITYDSTDPTLTTVSITSDGNEGWAKVSDTITLTIVADENISTPTATIAGQSASVTGSAKDWTATYLMMSDDTEGIVTFSIIFADLAGNDGTAVTVATDASSVTFDRTAPVVSISTPAESDKVNGDAVISFTTDESLPKCSVDGTNWTTCVTNTTTLNGIAEFAGLSEGTFTLYLIDTDAAGNVGTDSISLTKDTVAPTVISHVPTVNAMNVEPANDIVITFSEAVIVEIGDVTFSPTIAGFVIENSETNIVSINPNNALESNTSYTITLSGVTDLAGNVMANYNSINFTTATYYNISLYFTSTGWNLVSLPVVPNETAIETVLGDASPDIEEVWTYDPTHPNADDSGWLMYASADPEGTNNLDIMTTGYGYWISVTGNTNIEGWGSLLTAGPTAPPSRTLNTGWNLIGYYQIPGEDESTPSEAFASLENAYTGLWGYDNAGGVFKSTVIPILPGDAFWISLTSGKEYTPSNI